MIIGIVGYFSDENLTNGQQIRTQTICNALRMSEGDTKVKIYNYSHSKKKPLRSFIEYLKFCRDVDVVLLILAHNAVRVLVPMSVIIRKFFGIKVYYNVIGGWLPELLVKHKVLLYYVRQLDGVFVQTATLQKQLQDLRINNVTIFPNFKYIRIFKPSEINLCTKKPYKLCFMSRIAEKKGVSEMIVAIEKINSEQVKYHLDIYGSVDESYKVEFERLIQAAPDYIRYMGIADYKKTSEIFKNYFLHIFPTKSKTEGFPGSILDSFCAGVPVLAAKWNSFSDVIEEGFNGIGFQFGDYDDFKNTLEMLYTNPQVVYNMKLNCLNTANKYKPDVVIKLMTDVFKRKNVNGS
jgi:glycosyltransferase involved in cell wall biosynthesis